MADISKISPDAGTTEYNVKDATARSDIASLQGSLLEKFPRSEQAVLGAKNRLFYPYLETTKTENGITFTNNGDGSITISGTATADTYFTLENQSLQRFQALVGIPLIMSGGIREAMFRFQTPNGTIDQYGDEAPLLISAADLSSWYTVKIVVGNNVKFTSPVTIYPMLRLASDPDSTYHPYAMTNRELTEKLKVQESAVTDIVSGATVENNGMGNHLYKSGNVVELRLSLRSVTTNAWTTFARIPEGYRPKGTTNPVTVYDNRASQYFNIAPSGSIQCHGALSNGGFDIHATWITS